MKILTIICAFFICISVQGQFAIIRDNDGFTYVRNEEKKGNNIIDTLKNDHLIYCFEKSNNWTNIDFEKQGKDLNGYIYHNRFKLISSFESFKIQHQTNLSIALKKDSIEIKLFKGEFEKSKYKFKYTSNEKDQIALINREKYWGTDGGIPKYEYTKIIVNLGSQKITLPKAATENLFEPSLFNTEAFYDESTNTIYIQSMNSDGAGSYLVIWKIVNGKYSERFVAYGF